MTKPKDELKKDLSIYCSVLEKSYLYQEFKNKIKQQTAQEIFKELDILMKVDTYSLGYAIHYNKIKQKYLKGDIK